MAYNKQQFKEAAINKGNVQLDSDGKCFYIVCQINTNNFPNATKMLIDQLNDEGKYNDWIGFVNYTPAPPFSTDMLPIFGNPNQYVTKHFKKSAESVIDTDLKSKMNLLGRANQYLATL